MSAGTLYVVATPIGNLEDITLRALRVLKEADLIAAEDTRRTAGLLAHHGIATPTLSFHEHNARTRIPQVLERLTKGRSVAVVTDAGIPGVSDPGIELVQACVEANIPVEPIPGATAPLTAAVASGFSLDPLTIYGFPPSRSHDRTKWLVEVSEVKNTLTFFEAPHRIVATLEAGSDIWGDRPICVGRELTKAHQEFLRGSSRDVLAHLSEPRGEFTVVLGPVHKVAQENDLPFSDDIAASAFGELTKARGFQRRDAIAAVARKFGRTTREVYAAVERAKHAAD